MELHEQIVRALDALSNKYDEYGNEEPLVQVAHDRYRALKSEGQDFTTCAFIAKTEMVAAIIVRNGVHGLDSGVGS